MLRHKYSFKEYYLESFDIDIQSFLNDSIIINKKDYYLFGYRGDIIHITEEIKEY